MRALITMTDIPDNAALARQLYEEGRLTRDIMAETGLSLSALYFWLAGGPKKSGVRALPPLAKRKLVTRRRILKEERLHMVERMMRVAERQIEDIEQRLAGSGQEPGVNERDARTLAVLARTMQSLTALDAQNEPKATGAKQKRGVNDDDEDRIPADIDAIRRELSRSLEAMAADGAREISGETE
jgi:hypothetical protein